MAFSIRNKPNLGKLHEKLSAKYTKYLNANKSTPDVQLVGNFNYKDKPVSYYLNTPNTTISNSNLTPIPKRIKTFMKTKDEQKEYSSMQKTAITMRRIEYLNKFKIKRDKNTKYHYTKSPQYLYLIERIIKIQTLWKKYFKKKKIRATKIQKIFKGFIFRKYFNQARESYNKISRFIYIIQKISLLNLLKIKKFYKKNHPCFITKQYRIIRKIVLLQSYIRHFFIKKRCKMVYGKERCLFIKPINSLNLSAIKRIQHAIIVFLERLHRRKKLIKPVWGIKIYRPSSKILFIQRFIRYIITRNKVKCAINKRNYNRNFFFTKVIVNRESNEIKKSKTKVILPKKGNIKVKYKKILKLEYITKVYPNYKPILFLQRRFRVYLDKVRKSFIYFPKVPSYAKATKINMVTFDLPKLSLIQNHVRFFIFRNHKRPLIIHKVNVRVMKMTKEIKTMTEKTFERLSRLRVGYDKELIRLIVAILENIKRAYARKWFYKIYIPQLEIKSGLNIMEKSNEEDNLLAKQHKDLIGNSKRNSAPLRFNIRGSQRMSLKLGKKIDENDFFLKKDNMEKIKNDEHNSSEGEEEKEDEEDSSEEEISLSVDNSEDCESKAQMIQYNKDMKSISSVLKIKRANESFKTFSERDIFKVPKSNYNGSKKKFRYKDNQSLKNGKIILRESKFEVNDIY